MDEHQQNNKFKNLFKFLDAQLSTYKKHQHTRRRLLRNINANDSPKTNLLEDHIVSQASSNTWNYITELKEKFEEKVLDSNESDRTSSESGSPGSSGLLIYKNDEKERDVTKQSNNEFEANRKSNGKHYKESSGVKDDKPDSQFKDLVPTQIRARVHKVGSKDLNHKDIGLGGKQYDSSCIKNNKIDGQFENLVPTKMQTSVNASTDKSEELKKPQKTNSVSLISETTPDVKSLNYEGTKFDIDLNNIFDEKYSTHVKTRASQAIVETHESENQSTESIVDSEALPPLGSNEMQLLIDEECNLLMKEIKDLEAMWSITCDFGDKVSLE